MGNETFRCCAQTCQGEAISFAAHAEAPVDARASPLPRSAPSKPRGPGGGHPNTGQPNGQEADQASPFPAQPRPFTADDRPFAAARRWDCADNADVVAGAVPRTELSPGTEAECLTRMQLGKMALRSKLKEFIVDATDSVPVKFVDITNGTTQVGCYTLDPGLRLLTLEVSGERCCVTIRHIVDVFKPEDCLAWERAGHRWPATRLKRLVLVSMLATEGGETVRGWLEADEARRDRCVVCLSILAAPQEEDLLSGAKASDALAASACGDGGSCGAVPGEAGAAMGVSSRRTGHSAEPEATPEGYVAEVIRLGSSADDLACNDCGGTSSSCGTHTAVAALVEESAETEVAAKPAQSTAAASTARSSLGGGPPPPPPPQRTRQLAVDARGDAELEESAATSTAEELRRLTWQFAREAAEGVEGVRWIDTATGQCSPCCYKLDVALGDLVFFTAASAGSESAQVADSSSEAEAVAVAEKPMTEKTEPMTLCRMHLGRIFEIWRPEQRPHFADAHPWYGPMTPDERRCLLCMDFAGTPEAGHAAPVDEFGRVDGVATSTACFLERDPTARERFVVCAKVLKLSVMRA